MLWVTPRFARCDLVFLPEKPSAIVRSLPCAQVLLPLVAGIPSENFSHALAFSSLISWENFSLPAGSRTCTSVRLTNRHCVPSRAKNEEEEAGVAGHRFTNHKGGHTTMLIDFQLTEKALALLSIASHQPISFELTDKALDLLDD